MCKIELLRTRTRRVTPVERRGGADVLSYSQIQYYHDCVRALAVKRNLPVDASLNLIEKKNLLPIIEVAFQQNKKVFVAVRRMLKEIAV